MGISRSSTSAGTPPEEGQPRRVQVIVLLILGVAAAIAVVAWARRMGVIVLSLPAVVAVGVAGTVAAAAAFAPGFRARITRLITLCSSPSPATANGVAVGIAVLAGLYLFATAWWQATDFAFRLPDEFSYYIQARMLAAGVLWHAPHPAEVRPFFDSINILVEPTYGSMYFPGTALLYVPGVSCGLPYWVTTLVISAASVGLLYRLMVDLLDGVYAIIAALLLLGVEMFRALSAMLLSQSAMLMMGLVMMLAFIRWRRQQDWRWAAVVGGVAGWAGITRPADALCYAVPVGLAMLLDRRRRPAPETAASRPTATRRPWLVLVASLVVPAVPFLGLQVVQNVGMTGHWWEFPEARYADETYPAPMLGFHEYDLSTWKRPVSERKRLVSETYEEAFYRYHSPSEAPRTWLLLRLPETFLYGLPSLLLLTLMPAGLLMLRSRPRGVLAAVPVLFVGFYFFYVFYIPHYMVVLVPAFAMLILLGVRAVVAAAASLGERLHAAARVGLPLAVAGVSIVALPEFNPGRRDHAMFPGTEAVYVQYLLDELSANLGDDGRALVLFRFDLRTYLRGGEMVYTADAAWPDDAKIVRAADLGDRNIALFRYYADVAKQPDRLVYVYDATTGKLSDTPLGTVASLSRR